MKRTSEAAHTVLLVDDHPLIREAVRELVEQNRDLRVCAQADNCHDALAAVEQFRPDAAVVDLGLQDRSGLELIPEIRTRSPKTRILVLSMHDEGFYAERCLQAGAMGYVAKSDSPTKVVDGIRAILADRVFVSEDMQRRLLRKMAGGRRAAGSGGPVGQLTNRELEVFQAIGHGRATKEIAVQLHLSAKTVQTYREHIKTKLGIRTATQLVQRAAQWVQSRNGAG